MYKAEAELFLSANNNINYAKTLINECKRLISEAELPNNSDYTNCKESINDCNIKGLTDLVEKTKSGLFQLDAEFADRYMSLLQAYLQTDTIDTSNMTEEEKMQYSIQMNAYYRDYNYNLLYMLEKYESTGQLTPELQNQLEIQRALIRQYEIQYEMAGLLTTSDEYIELFKKSSEIDRQLIELNSELSAVEKKAALSEYDANFKANLEILELNHDIAELTAELKELETGSKEYYELENEIRELQIEYLEGKGTLTKEEQKQLQYLYDGIELNELYIDKENNNGFFHPFVEGELDEAILDQKISMGIATDDEIAYVQMNGWERAWENTKTFTTSTVFGIGSVTETVIDGTVMIAGEVGSWFGADTQWAEDFVSICYATDAYSGIVQSGGINSVSAYSGWHDAGNMLGSTAGYIGLSLLPGGKITAAVTGGLSAMGSSTERAFNSGATWDEAMLVGTVSGTIGAVTGYGVGGGITSGAKTWGQVVGKTFMGAGVSMLEPIVNSGTEYFVYANDMVDENGNKIYDNLLDYYVEGGGLTNTVMAFGAGTVSSGLEAVLKRNFPLSQKQIRAAFIENLKTLSSNGYDVEQAVDYIISKGEFNNCYAYRRTAAETCYELLLANGHSPESAANVIAAKYGEILTARGMTTAYVDENGISYNVINGLVEGDQKYTIPYIHSVLSGMPNELRSSIKSIEIYDTFNPADFYWQNKYNNTSGYFKSAATGSNGTIRIYATEYINPSTLYHEAGHCFDVEFARSNSKIYAEAIANDKALNGLDSITSYGKNAVCEDFAETVAAYFGNQPSVNIENFPNRKLVLDMFFQQVDYQTTMNNLQKVNSFGEAASPITPTRDFSQKYNSVNDFLCDLQYNTKKQYSAANVMTELHMYKKIDIETIYNDMVSAGKISPTNLPLKNVQALFLNSGITTFDGIEIPISNEVAIKRTLIEVMENGGGNGKTSSQLFQELGLTLDDPIPSSMTTLESRVWYLESEKTISSKLEIFKENNTNASLREQALFCYNERNRLRQVSREAMQDELMSQYLMAAEKKDFAELFNKKMLNLTKKYGRDIIVEEVYQDIIDGSKKSRIPLNMLLGIGEGD